MVDAGVYDEPGTRYFGTLEAAKKAMAEIDEKWVPFIQIAETTEVGLRIIHVRNGADARPES